MRRMFIIAAILVAAGCTSVPAATSSQSQGSSLSSGVIASPSPAPPSADPSPSRPSSMTPLAAGSFAITTIDNVRVRSEPSVEATSRKYSPLLPIGTTLYVIDGPVAGSEYDWWRIALVDQALTDGLGYGWVAGADHDGTPWIAGSAYVCPDPSADLAELVGLSDGLALGCFARQPITVRARIIAPGIDIDGPGLRPQWFAWGDPPTFLVDPSTTTLGKFEDSFMLHVDPDAGIDPVPVDKVVDATGLFDHPAAEGCLGYVGDGSDFSDDAAWAPSIACRFGFAVTGVTVVGG